MGGLQTTIVGVLGEQLPRHEDWNLDEATDESCVWRRETAEETGPQSLTLLYSDGDWSLSIRRVLYEDEIPTNHIEIIELDSILDMIETLQEWMNEVDSSE